MKFKHTVLPKTSLSECCEVCASKLKCLTSNTVGCSDLGNKEDIVNFHKALQIIYKNKTGKDFKCIVNGVSYESDNRFLPKPIGRVINDDENIKRPEEKVSITVFKDGSTSN